MKDTKTKCQTCGHIIAGPKIKLSSTEFRRYLNNITDLNVLISSKDYITRFVSSQLWGRSNEAENFLNDLEKIIKPSNDIEFIKIWIFSFINSRCLEKELCEFLKSAYSNTGINEPFNEFYQKYVEAEGMYAPLNKNRVSRVLTALGLKTVMKKVIRESGACVKTPGKSTSTIMICATNRELNEILRKNGF